MSCFKCRKITEKLTPDRGKDKKKKGKPMLLSKCAVCDSTKSKFGKEQEANGVAIK